jgi:xylose isomerase
MNALMSLATRLNSFCARGLDVATAIRAVAAVPGISALELNYPQHLESLAENALAALLTETGLRLTGLNLRFEGAEFAAGAFTNPRPATRARAIRLAQDAVELAGRHGASHVIIWLADDGFDYPFQVDFSRLWHDAITGFRQVAAHDPSIRVSVEYKPIEPRRFAVIRAMGEAMVAVYEVGMDNFGVTLDFCHALMAGEHPPAAAALALRQGKLFGVHLNDGHGRADDGLMVGSVHPWETLELLALLRTEGYAGTIYFDTFPVREDPALECATNVATVRHYQRLLDRLDWAALEAIRLAHDGVAARRLLDSTRGQ